MLVRRKYKHLDAGNFAVKAGRLHPANYLMFLVALCSEGTRDIQRMLCIAEIKAPRNKLRGIIDPAQ